MAENLKARWNGRRALCAFVLAAILLAPSAWMLQSIPPLWRDLDAYNQAVNSPGRSAANGNGPLYGAVLRGPLVAGYFFERLRGTTPPAEENLYLQPPLTDAGVQLLLVSQHLALAAGGFLLLMTAAQAFWLRALLALFFASNPILYTFAHTVGSESLSLSALLFFTVAGLRLAARIGQTTPRDWFWFGLTLLLCLLTRYANNLLLLVLPLTFLLLALARRTTSLLRHAALAAAIGLLVVFLARDLTEAMVRGEGLKFYGRAGFTFLWRVSFLEKIPEPRRSELLREVAARTRSKEGRRALESLGGMLRAGEPMASARIFDRLRVDLARPGEKEALTRRVHEALNQVLLAFLSPPPPELRAAAGRDIAAAWEKAPPAVGGWLFNTTAYYFDHRAEMPKFAPLYTHRAYSQAEIFALPNAHAYLQFWARATFARCFAGWLVLGGLLLFAARWRRRDLLPVWLYGALLVVAGLLMVQSTAFIGELLPRYLLPLWELLWFSTIIYAGALGRLLRPEGESPPGGIQPG